MENLNILEQALNIAAQKGCFNLADSAIIVNALNQLKEELSGIELQKVLNDK